MSAAMRTSPTRNVVFRDGLPVLVETRARTTHPTPAT